MKIPTQIQLHAQTIKTVYDDNLMDNHDCVGEARYRKNEIALQTLSNTTARPITQQEQWYCHELVHHILNQMGKDELDKDEAFVDLFANLLHQALVTAKY